MMSFVLKKVVGELLMPLPVISILLLGGMLALWKGHQRWARGLLGGGVLLLLLLSNRWVANILISPLEQQYPPYAGQPVEVVLILGNLQNTAEGIPSTSVLEQDSMYRLIEGLRIALLNPEARIVLSGYASGNTQSMAESYRDVVLELGVDPSRLVLHKFAKDTAEEMAVTYENHWTQPVAVVTSAYHMPRSMAAAKKAGLNAVAAPTWHRAKPGMWHWSSLFPKASSLDISYKAWHEYLGLLWYKLRGLS